ARTGARHSATLAFEAAVVRVAQPDIRRQPAIDRPIVSDVDGEVVEPDVGFDRVVPYEDPVRRREVVVVIETVVPGRAAADVLPVTGDVEEVAAELEVVAAPRGGADSV